MSPSDGGLRLLSLCKICLEIAVSRQRGRRRLRQKGSAAAQLPDAEMLRQRLTYIGEALAAAERTRRDRGPEGEHGNVLARMVGAVPGRIAAVISGDDREIAKAQRPAESRRPGLQASERPRQASPGRAVGGRRGGNGE